jgi:GT2 family glycosyltransferase/glycosyltransferase involved in cell wall biosynthesis
MNNVRENVRWSPHWIIDEEIYLKYNPDVREAVRQRAVHSGYLHFLSTQGVEVRRFNNLFNNKYYASRHGIEPSRAVTHFLTRGIYDGTSPSPLFDQGWYSSLIVGDAKYHSFSGGAYEHCLREGVRRGISCIPDFDVNYYLKAYPDIENAIRLGHISSAFYHFLNDGIDECRNPNQYVNLGVYKASNPDVGLLIKDQVYNSYFEHFVAQGYKEGRNIGNDLSGLSADSDSTKIAFNKIAAVVANKIARRNPVELPPTDSAEISIVIPVFNQFEMTVQCIESIRSSDSRSYEIIIVDNGSTDDTVNIGKYYKGIKYIRARTNEGYAGGCNIGAEQAVGKIVVFANNDIVVFPDTITNILDFMEQNAKAGALGGQVISTAGVLQEAGCGIWSTGSTFGYGRGDDPKNFRYSYPRKVDFCSGCFLAVRKSILDDIGVFDEIFKPGYYEETDLCARIYQHGFEVWYSPAVQIIHYEFASFSKGRPPQASFSMIVSKQKLFCKKQQAFLSTKMSPSLPGCHVAADLSALEKPTVIIVEDLLPLRWIGSGFSRTNDVVRSLSENGYNVIVVVCNKSSKYENIAKHEDVHGAKILYADEINYDLESLVDNIPNVVAIQVCRTHNADRFANSLRSISLLKKRPKMILDTEAISCIREEFGSLPSNYRDNVYLKSAVKRELATANYFDEIIYVNELDREVAEISGITNDNLILSGTAKVAAAVNGYAARKNFLFVGAVHAESAPNYQSLAWFIMNVFPLIREEIPDAGFDVVGFWDDKVPTPDWMSAPGVNHVGKVPDANVPMDNGRVFVVPTLAAAGIPQKCVEAIARGLPMVVTEIIGRQIGNADGTMFLAAQDAGAFARKCVDLYTNAELWTAISDTSLQYARQNFATEAFTRKVLDVVRR